MPTMHQISSSRCRMPLSTPFSIVVDRNVEAGLPASCSAVESEASILSTRLFQMIQRRQIRLQIPTCWSQSKTPDACLRADSHTVQHTSVFTFATAATSSVEAIKFTEFGHVAWSKCPFFFCQFLYLPAVAILSNSLPKMETPKVKIWQKLLGADQFDPMTGSEMQARWIFCPWNEEQGCAEANNGGEHRMETVWNSSWNNLTYFLCWHTLGAYQCRHILSHWIIFSTRIAEPLGWDQSIARVPVPKGQRGARVCRLPKGPLFEAPERESFGPRFELYLHSVGLKALWAICMRQSSLLWASGSYAHYGRHDDHSQPFCRPQIPSIAFVHGAFSCEWCRREPDRPR